MKNNLDWILTDISEKEINEAFNDSEWEDNVVDAAFYGATKLLKISPEKDPATLIAKIITYNVNKKLNQFFAARVKPLPKKLVFDNTDLLTDVLYILDNYMSLAYILSQAQKLNTTTRLDIYTSTQALQDKIKEWYKKIKIIYEKDSLNINYNKISSKHLYLTIKYKKTKN